MNRKASDYGQMAKVINYLSQHYTEQPTLEKLASIAGLSPHHLQRKFTAWAGVSPKSFLQYLTFDNAKQMLAKGENVLDVAHDSGLSGPSRLHDLCITIEAASPGEIKRGGENICIDYGFAYSPFGECLIASSARGIVHVAFIENEQQEHAVNELRYIWPKAKLIPNEKIALDIIQGIFNPVDGQALSLRAYVKGSKFQLRVWNALLNIRPGKLVTYGQLAGTIGQPTASRAVGSAVGKNPLAYLIPCHRVIRATGVIGHYRWGPDRKRLMLAYEAVRK